MKIAIDGVTYEFDNSNTDAIYNKQKEYVTKLINESQEKEKLEELLNIITSPTKYNRSAFRRYIA